MPPRKSDPARARQAVSIADKVAFLSDPKAFTPPPERVEVIETHMAWVFLAGPSVYKLKKPVRYPFLDFSTLALRERTCRDEVRLNRRLAPDVYLGVVALTVGTDSRLALDGSGEIVDWLVKMRRLPEERMLDRAIAARSVGRPKIEALAEVLSAFYRRADPVRISGSDYVARFCAEQATNRDVLTRPDFALDMETLHPVLDAIDAVLTSGADLLERRAEEGRIVEGHGDLKPDHVCVLARPVVIDCLEFNRELRLIDPFDELAFLGLECELIGAPWISGILIAHCAEHLGDRPPDALIAFYTSYRACLRARLMLAHLFEPDPREPDKWMPRARRYLELAERARLRLSPPAGR